MDQQVFEQSPAKYRSILLEMRRDASPGLNMLYLSGLAETFALIDAENGLEPGSHNLNVRSIARVMRAWGDFEGETWAGGFVLELRDGRRVYVESYADGPDLGTWLLRVSRGGTYSQPPCRSCQRTTTPSCMAGSRISPS
jgi:hypothetical protein